MLIVAEACGGSKAIEAGPAATGAIDSDGDLTVSAGLPCDVDADLAKNCRMCHSAPPQFGAPMPLTTWDNLHASAVSDASKRVYETK